MGLSQQIGASSLSKPGVCTSSTRPATPYEGQMIYETDTDKVLVYNGTAWVIPNSPAQNPTGLEYITQATMSTTSTEIDNCFTSTFQNYQVVVNIASATTNANINMQLRAGGVSSVGAYDQQGDIVATTTSVTLISSANSYGFGVIELGGPQVADFTAGTTLFHGLNTTILAVCRRTSFDADVQTQFDGFRIFSTATLTGTIRVYGYRNS